MLQNPSLIDWNSDAPSSERISRVSFANMPARSGNAAWEIDETSKRVCVCVCVDIYNNTSAHQPRRQTFFHFLEVAVDVHDQ